MIQLNHIFDRFRKKDDSDEKGFVIEQEPEKELTPEEEAESVAQIVTDGIVNHNIGQISSELEQIHAENTREDCVFIEPHRHTGMIPCVFLAVISCIFIADFAQMFRVLGYTDAFTASIDVYLVWFVILLVLNVIFIRNTIWEAGFSGRYQKYYYLMKYKRIVLTEELADYARVSRKRVIRDIDLAIRRNLIPQGYFGMNDDIIILSNEQYRDYQNNYAAYNRYFEKLIDEYRRVGERPEEIQQLLDEGKQYADRIHEDNDLIKDKEISDKLDEMEHTVTVIFREIDIDPANADKLGLLLNYYLPTTEKLLQTYIELDEKGIEGENVSQIRKQIADSLDMTNKAYQRILDSFFAARDMDISSDISAMSAMMEQEGLIDAGSGD